MAILNVDHYCRSDNESSFRRLFFSVYSILSEDVLLVESRLMGISQRRSARHIQQYNPERSSKLRRLSLLVRQG